ncbi:DUF427 domain-containing protein [Haliovirga abyssi]|uniref:DUF427 domain-containing protein n=1 Tax=Haliovirga abyssi TaxID=2996794 RepID=A0AAU9DRW1_9FUSO|nr:DUF427 domain-containing protein [Haliovirga abyssi]BDU49704.1 hypothetical protein HLVA_02730 [Haliovirga abyssi]
MIKVMFNNTLIAETNNCIAVEGNYYFPLEDVMIKYLGKSDYHTVCPWKGDGSYYNLKAEGKVVENAAWYYPEPKEEAKKIKNYIAFDKKVFNISEE